MCLDAFIPVTQNHVELERELRLHMKPSKVGRDSFIRLTQGHVELERELRLHMNLPIAGNDTIKVSHILVKHSASRKAEVPSHL